MLFSFWFETIAAMSLSHARCPKIHSCCLTCIQNAHHSYFFGASSKENKVALTHRVASVLLLFFLLLMFFVCFITPLDEAVWCCLCSCLPCNGFSKRDTCLPARALWMSHPSHAALSAQPNLIQSWSAASLPALYSELWAWRCLVLVLLCARGAD